MSDPAALIETHISVIVFIADRAFKLKKPVRFGFLDFSDREAREKACNREVELNRRIAPDVYLGVADVVGPDGQMADHLVVMKRMPVDRQLATLVANRDPSVSDELRRIAKLVSSFHLSAVTGEDIDSAATRDAVASVWEAGFEELAPYLGSLLDGNTEARVEQLARTFLAGREPLFTKRIAEGRIRDGHGDLQAADVYCLDDGPRVLDCIEFDDRLRYGDIVSDVAFLVMDMERLGDRASGMRFLEFSCEYSGDDPPASLVHHYIAQRAHIRTKVAVLRAAQSPAGSRDYINSIDEAEKLIAITLDHLKSAQVRMIVVGGSPGTGKSTLSRGIGDALGITVLRSDEIRKERAGLSATTRIAADFGEGLYGAEATRDTYGAMMASAKMLLEHGESVILDASFTSASFREDARRIARETHSGIVEIRCEVSSRVAAERIANRQAAGTDASDATPRIALALAASAEPWPEAAVISTGKEPALALNDALQLLDLDDD